MIENYRGVFTPLITPFKEDFSIDFDALNDLLDFLISQKVTGFFINATTGEFTSLTHAEKKLYGKFVKEKTKGKAINLINVSSTVMNEVIDLARFAKEEGFDGVVSPPPFFLIPDRNGIFNYFKRISEESNLLTFLYDIPSATGYSIPENIVIELIEKCPNIAGIKVTYDSLEYIRNLIVNGKSIRPFTVMTGIETYFIPTLISGGDGGIVALSNFAPGLFVNAFDAFKNKDFDRTVNLQSKIMELFEVYKLTNSFAAAIKISLKHLGFNLSTITRLPLIIDTSNEEKIKDIINKILK